MPRARPAPPLALAAALAALALGACKGGGSDDSGSGGAERIDLSAVKDYLLAHTGRLARDTARIRATAERYYDYARLLDQRRAEVRDVVRTAQREFARANPAYERMEGVVAGVPSLAEYDVIIDAGGDASDPENAVPFDVETPAGRTFEQPGNFNYLIETAAFGTEPRFAAKGARPDLDGDGRVEFGEALPDADFYVAAARDFARYAEELDEAAHDWEPS